MSITINVTEANLAVIALSRYKTQIETDIKIGDDLWENEIEKRDKLFKVENLIRTLWSQLPKSEEE